MFDAFEYDRRAAVLRQREARARIGKATRELEALNRERALTQKARAALQGARKRGVSAPQAQGIVGGGNPRSSIGDAWMHRGLSLLSRTKQLAAAMSRGVEVNVTNASMLQHGYSSMRELASAAMIATGGESRKDYRQGALNANVSNVLSGASALAGITVFGWRIRLTGSFNNFSYRPVTIQIGPVLNTAGVFTVPNPVLTVVVTPMVLPADIFVLSPANAGGLATIYGGTQAETLVTLTTSARNGVVIESIGEANTFGIIETLTQRDLIARPTNQSIEDMDGVPNPIPETFEGNVGFGGIRDAAQDVFELV